MKPEVPGRGVQRNTRLTARRCCPGASGVSVQRHATVSPGGRLYTCSLVGEIVKPTPSSRPTAERSYPPGRTTLTVLVTAVCSGNSVVTVYPSLERSEER